MPYINQLIYCTNKLFFFEIRNDMLFIIKGYRRSRKTITKPRLISMEDVILQDEGYHLVINKLFKNFKNCGFQMIEDWR